ncbi:hypothetical protein PHYSODRAFT_481443 [Phytophthora sojae]|uniref:Uncharacterized protein n=1 Tax=Phytophthora sojae (strain P6497) TaxID=1094619 RepID=G4Z120_PHYSP|nr:hypothetical protein PHYSODRAFT_481443 [Phytophthora sojae]EGZ24021.1 hypothetical protein PHYSODRAFT_481443 [Phytophthora sojae]|eukprot:XP_009519309.1 hypothetical protein PHYSODRAFT_481443 [Phytophthora sojae]
MPETSAPSSSVHEDEVTPSPSTVGNTFMRQYYHFLAKEPQSLHRFYKAESRWCHGLGSHMEEPIAGQRAINDQILKRGYAGARVDLDAGSIDCQNSLGGGVFVLVTGVMTLRSSPVPKPFVQTFFLAVQPKGYFVLNDCLRFLELPGASPVEKTKEDQKKQQQQQKDELVSSSPVPASPKKAAASSPVKAAATKTTTTTTTKKVVKEAAAPTSPVKATATVASSPVKKTTTTTTTTTTKPKEEDAKVKTPSPVKSPAKSPVKSPKKQEKAPAAAASPAPAAAPTAAPADPVIPAPAEPEKPKTWAALFSASKAVATITPPAAAAPAAPVKPATPKPAAAPAAAPAPAAIAPATGAPAPEKSPKSKAGNGKEKEHKRLYSLFIRDVPTQARENDLRELFKGYGSIAGVSIPGQRGFGFVDFHEQESMRAALAETKEFKLFEKVLQVGERAERKEGQRGGFRGNDSRGRGRGHGPKGGRGERKERNGDEAPKSDRREGARREKTGSRRGGKVDGASDNRAE